MRKSTDDIVSEAKAHIHSASHMTLVFDERKLADSGCCFSITEEGNAALLVRTGNLPIFHEDYERFVEEELGNDALGEMRHIQHVTYVGILLKKSIF